jgi:hypothetical protein
MKRTYAWIFLVFMSVATMPIQSWHVPHWLVMVGTVILAAGKVKGWTLQHWLTVLGAVLLAGISTWLKYGGPDFQLADTPILGLILLVLRALYQTPPVKT